MDVNEKEQVARKLIECVTGYTADEGCFFLVLALDAIVTSVTYDDRSYEQSMNMIINYLKQVKAQGRHVAPGVKQ
jgi:hypothetical protein